MKQILFIPISLLFLLIASAFTQKQQQTNTEPAVYKLMEVTFLWDLLSEGYEPNRERDDTWLDVGFRSKYAMAKKYASLEMLQKAFDEPVFVIGPHGKDMNFNDKTSFGHYNTRFITKLEASIQTALQNPLFRKTTKKVYDEYLVSMAHTYRHAYVYLNKDAKRLKKLKKKYIAMMDSPEGTTDGSLQEEFRDFAEALEQNEQADVYEGFTAPAFWLRRSIDGTAEQFFAMLEMVIEEMEK